MGNSICGSRVSGTDGWVSNNAQKSTDARNDGNVVDHLQAHCANQVW